MKKTIAVIMMMFMLCIGIAYAGYDSGAKSAEGEGKTAITDAGNKICPVTGAHVDGLHYYEYNGKRYALCCAMCSAIFAADPAKYAAIADKEVAEKK